MRESVTFRFSYRPAAGSRDSRFRARSRLLCRCWGRFGRGLLLFLVCECGCNLSQRRMGGCRCWMIMHPRHFPSSIPPSHPAPSCTQDRLPWARPWLLSHRRILRALFDRRSRTDQWLRCAWRGFCWALGEDWWREWDWCLVIFSLIYINKKMKSLSIDFLKYKLIRILNK